MVLVKAAVLLTVLVVLFVVLGVMIYRDVTARRRAAAEEQAEIEERARARAESRLQTVGSEQARARTLAAREASQAHALEAFESAKAEARRRVDEVRRQRAAEHARQVGESLGVASAEAARLGAQRQVEIDPDATMVHDSLRLAHGQGYADDVSTTTTTRDVSGLDEVSDGGFGVGSAAPLPDGAMPLGHPVKGFVDTMTYLVPEHAAYSGAVADVWFTDADVAEWAGFDPAS